MPAFATPGPIRASIRLESGTVRITAEDRADTVVEVAPSSDGKKADVRAVERTQISFEDGRLVVECPKARNPLGDPGSVTVEIALPLDSDLDAATDLGGLSAEGRLGDCAFRTGAGRIRVDRAAAVRLRTGHGDVTLDRAGAGAEISTGSGEVRVGHVEGRAEISNSNGSTWLDEVTGELTVKAANGGVDLGRAHADVTVKAVNGGIRVEEAARGTVDLRTKAGDVEVGVSEGTAVHLDVKSASGTVRSSLKAADGPGDSARSVELRARTGLGDIVINRVPA